MKKKVRNEETTPEEREIIIDNLVKRMETEGTQCIQLQPFIETLMPKQRHRAKSMTKNVRRNLYNIMSTHFNHLDHFTKAGLLMITHTEVHPDFEELMKDIIVVGEDRYIKLIKTPKRARDKQDVEIVVMSGKEEETTPNVHPPPRSPSTETPTMENTQTTSVPDCRLPSVAVLEAALKMLTQKETQKSTSNSETKHLQSSSVQNATKSIGGFPVRFDPSDLTNIRVQQVILDLSDMYRKVCRKASGTIEDVILRKTENSYGQSKMRPDNVHLTFNIFYMLIFDICINSRPTGPDSSVPMLDMMTQFEEIKSKYKFDLDPVANAAWQKIKNEQADYPTYISYVSLQRVLMSTLERI